MSKTNAMRDKTGVKPGKNQGQNRVQYRVKTRAKPGSTWSPYNPTVVLSPLSVRQPQSRTTTSLASASRASGRLRPLMPVRSVWFTASLAAPAQSRGRSGPAGQRICTSPSPQSVRRPFAVSPSVRASNVMLPPAQFPSAGVQQPRRRPFPWRRRGLSFPSAQKFQQEPMGGSFPHFVLSITGPDRRASPSWPKDFSS